MSVIIDTSIKKAVKGAMLVFAGTVLSSLFLFAIKVLIVRNTTTVELGEYTLTIALASVFALVATLGVHEGIARYVSLFLGKNRQHEAMSLSRTAIRIVLISGVSAGLVLYLSSDLLADVIFQNGELAHLFKIVSISIPFFVLMQILCAIARGYGFVALKIYLMDIGIPLLFFILICGILFLRLPFLSIMYAYVISMILVCVCIVFYGYRQIGVSPFCLRDSSPVIDLLRFSLPLLIGIIMGLVINWTDVLMLGRYTGPSTVGVYDAGISLSRLLQFPLNALEFVFLPIAGTLHARGQSEELARTYQVLTKWVFIVTFPIFSILFIYPEQIITFLFSSRFIDAVPVLRILSGGFLFHALWGPNGILMVIIGMTKEISYVSILGAVINIISNYFLISVFVQGTVGAAAATIGTYMALNLLASYIVFKKTGIHPFTKSYIKSIAGAFAVGGIFFHLSARLPSSVWHLPLYLMIIAGGYGIVLFMIRSIDKEDVSLFKTVIKSIEIKCRALKNS
jgi:O-antigen/teichoic acid export membrane protein